MYTQTFPNRQYEYLAYIYVQYIFPVGVTCLAKRSLKSILSICREGEEPKIFYLHPSLASEEAETQFFREAVEVLLVLLLPERLAGCETARQLLREIFTCQGKV